MLYSNSSSNVIGGFNVTTPVGPDEITKYLTASGQHIHFPPPGELPFNLERNHPHQVKYYCEQCKKDVTASVIYSMCFACNSNVSTAEEIENKDFTFGYIDGDLGVGVPIFVTVPCSVRYTNNYKKYTDPYTPPMEVFNSQVVATASPAPNFPDMVCVPLRESNYYKDKTLIVTEQLSFGGNTSVAISNTAKFPFPVLKSVNRAVAQATFGMVSSTYSYELPVEIKF